MRMYAFLAFIVNYGCVGSAVSFAVFPVMIVEASLLGAWLAIDRW